MNKIFLIIGREYFSRVMKKSFLLTTIGVPLIIMGFYAAIIAISIEDADEKQKIAIIDEANLFEEKISSDNKLTTFSFIKNETESSFVKKYKDQGFQSFLYIPLITLDNPGKFVLHSESNASLTTMTMLEKIINKAIREKRLIAQGINPAEYDKISEEVSLENKLDTKDGAKKSNAGVAYGVSFGCGFLIYMMMIVYGTQVMRGVTEEKTNRIAEVVVSSVKPFQLMMGKILGIGAVGLTQFAIWIALLLSMQMMLPVLFPDMINQINNASTEESKESVSAIATAVEGIAALPIGKIISAFIFYFLGGYLTYASVFAAVGSVVSEDQQEAQQMVFPILMPIILGFVIMTKAINDPNSSLAVFGSIFPLTSPIVMMGRITYDIPIWQIIISAVLLIACFLFLTWVTGKIYRIGILMYGKKPSWKEIMKWSFAKN